MRPGEQQSDHSEHRRGEYSRFQKFLGKGAAVALIAGAGVYAADRYNPFDDVEMPSLPSLSDIAPALEPDPPVANASVDPEFTEIEETFDIRCRAQIGVAVGVRGFKNGPFGDGKVNKKYFGDFLACSDVIEGTATLIPNSQTGEIIQVDIKYAPLEVTHARIDMEDGRNCADVNSDETLLEAEEKIQEREEAIANGDNPGCDDGFKVSQLGGSSSLAEVIPFSQAVAQLAIYTVDPDAYEEINDNNRQEIIDYYKRQYPKAIVKIAPTKQLSYVEEVKQTLLEHQAEVMSTQKNSSPVFESVTIERTNEGEFCSDPAIAIDAAQCNVLVAYGYDGSSARVTLSDVETSVSYSGDSVITSSYSSLDDPKILGPVGVDPMQDSPFFDEFTPKPPGPVGVEPQTNTLEDFLNISGDDSMEG